MTELLDRPIGEIVDEDIRRAIVFEEYGLDFCCNDRPRLREVCDRRGINPEQVLKRLENLTAQAPQLDEVDGLSPTELVEHITRQHHDFLRRKLPQIEGVLTRVNRTHRERHPELQDLLEQFQVFRAEIEEHLYKEEEILFPHIKLLEIAFRIGSVPPQSCFQTVRQPIAVMEDDHDRAQSTMNRLRSLANDFKPPPAACNSWRLAMHELAELEQDMNIHMAKEDFVLHRLAKEMEDIIKEARRSNSRISAVLRRIKRERQADDETGE